MRKLRVFISSTMEDLKEERMELAKAIDKNRFWKAVYAETFVARSKSPREVCLEEVRESHIYIGIFKNRYGYIPKHYNPQGFSVVALEYNEAKNNGIPILIFIHKDSKNREAQLRDFLKEITDFDTGHWRKEYSDIEELVKFAIEAIEHEITERAVRSIEEERKKNVKDIYNLPYLQRLKRIL